MNSGGGPRNLQREEFARGVLRNGRPRWPTALLACDPLILYALMSEISGQRLAQSEILFAILSGALAVLERESARP